MSHLWGFFVLRWIGIPSNIRFYRRNKYQKKKETGRNVFFHIDGTKASTCLGSHLIVWTQRYILE